MRGNKGSVGKGESLSNYFKVRILGEVFFVTKIDLGAPPKSRAWNGAQPTRNTYIILVTASPG